MRLVINNILRVKVNGGALQYTILFSLVIVMSLSLFLMYIRLNSLEVIKAQKQTQLIENINSSLVILENKPTIFDKKTVLLHLLDDTTYLNNIEISEWGFYDKVKISSQKDRQQLSKVFLFTDNVKKQDQMPSLYFSGPNQYLTVGGKTYLGNNSFLPAFGIRKSYVNGIGYKRDSLTHGKSFKAAKILPSLNKELERRYNYIQSMIKLSASSEIFNEVNKDSLSISFNEESLLIRFPNNYYLKNKYLNGNIVLSGKKIRISNSCQLHNCIVVADSIFLDNKFKGEVQLFANNYIEVGDSAVLRMPSVLYLNNRINTHRILVRSNSNIQGDIIVPHAVREFSEILIIEEGCKMIGQIYCNGYSSFEGTLFGSLYTTGFIKRSPNGFYENYLLDVCIDCQRLPEEYCGITLVNNSKGKLCAEEIY